MTEKENFKEFLAKIEDPSYDYREASWALPENPTLLEKTKYELCKQILIYKQNNKLNTEEVAKKIGLTISETADLFYYHIDYFTLDRLMIYTEKLITSAEVKIIIEANKSNWVSHEKVI